MCHVILIDMLVSLAPLRRILPIAPFLLCCKAVSRAYPKGCSDELPSYYSYDDYELPPRDVPIRTHEEFALLRRLGAGKFSDVFEAVEIKDQKVMDIEFIEELDPKLLCVIKCLKPVSERKIKRELLVLSHASKLPNLARLKAFVVSRTGTDEDGDGQQTSMPSIVMEHAGRYARWLCHGLGCDPTSLTENLRNELLQRTEEPYHLSEYEIKYYLCHLLIALDSLHSRGIMHRDVKPRNVLINRRWPPTRLEDIQKLMNEPSDEIEPPSLMLIDLGLADFYLPHERYNVRVASRHYKAPELLVGNGYYDYGVDIWGVGCILAGLLLRVEPLFKGKDNVDQLGKIVSILGSRDLITYCEKYGINLSMELKKVIRKYTIKSNPSGRRKPWLSLLPKSTEVKGGGPVPLPSQESINLLDQLLVYDHELRLTAREAMMHPFFDEVRDLCTLEVQHRWNVEQRIRMPPGRSS